MAKENDPLDEILIRVRRCRECATHLPLGPRPIVQVGIGAKLLIIGQAPGTKVHQTGVPWDDPSGDHLREWMSINKDVFYDGEQISLMPMGFCYPGKKKGGDAPPRPECAPLWHSTLMKATPNIKHVLLIGQYAHAYYLGADRKKSVTETVRAFDEYSPKYLALPHPSWRSKIWMKKNPWFESAVLPKLRRAVNSALSKKC
jgi:uracil-DNA glycosylase